MGLLLRFLNAIVLYLRAAFAAERMDLVPSTLASSKELEAFDSKLPEPLRVTSFTDYSTSNQDNLRLPNAGEEGYCGIVPAEENRRRFDVA